MAETKFYYRDPEAPSPNQPIGLGVVALIEQDGCLLMEKRTDSDRWAVIGGALEMNESLLDALAREVMEETGLTVRSATLMGTFSDPSRLIAHPNGRVKRIVSMAYRVEVEPFTSLVISEESRDIVFVPRAELTQLKISETHLPIIRAYLEDAELTLE